MSVPSWEQKNNLGTELGTPKPTLNTGGLRDLFPMFQCSQLFWEYYIDMYAVWKTSMKRINYYPLKSLVVSWKSSIFAAIIGAGR